MPDRAELPMMAPVVPHTMALAERVIQDPVVRHTMDPGVPRTMAPVVLRTTALVVLHTTDLEVPVTPDLVAPHMMALAVRAMTDPAAAAKVVPRFADSRSHCRVTSTTASGR